MQRASQYDEAAGAIPARSTLYVLTTLLLLASAGALSGADWRSTAEFHTLLEASAHLLALFVAVIAFVRYYTRPTNTFLFIATAFLGTALLDGYHAIVTTTYVSAMVPSNLSPLIAWSWLASRLFLSVFLCLSYVAWRRAERLGTDAEWSPRTIYGVAALLTTASFLFFASVRLPQAYFPEIAAHRPQDFVPAVFFALALYGFLRKGDWRRDPLEHSLVMSILLGLAAQAAFIAWASTDYDAMFDAAHLLKNASYLAVLVGLLTEIHFVYRREREGAALLRRSSAELSHEIVERRRAETAREELEQQLRQGQKLEAVGQLAGGIAHDFNNVLTAVTGYAQLGLRRIEPEDPLAEDLRRVQECAGRGAKLVQQLVAFSRGQRLQRTVFSLNPLVTSTTTLISRLITAEIELIVETTPRIGNVEADANQIEQVLVNLAVNARDAMANGGTLTISTDTVLVDVEMAERIGAPGTGTFIVLAVRDTGSGMDAQTQERVFEPFFSTKEVGKGSGLGLATVYGIVKQHGGAIVIDSALGRGTTFLIYLPSVDNSGEAPITATRGDETLLVVEDEPMVRDVAVRFLEDHGYTVLTAAGPAEAEQLYQEHHDEIELLITDVVMPGLNGRELYFRLTMNDPALKVLFMSGYADEVLGQEEPASLGEFFIQKPFTSDAFVGRVRQLLDT